jgi:hypothetical protein
MSGPSGGPPGGKTGTPQLISLRSVTTRPSASPSANQVTASPKIGARDLISNLRHMASTDLQLRNQAADVLCELSRHDVTSRKRLIQVSNYLCDVLLAGVCMCA